MRWVLPGGAVLGARDRKGDERAVACRPRAAVVESVRPPRPPTVWKRLLAAVKPVQAWLAGFSWRRPFPREGLADVKLVLEVLGLLVALITAVLALLGWSRN
jgi:hypothetical protein